MTTNLNAIAGPSKLTPTPMIDPDSPTSTISDHRDMLQTINVSATTPPGGNGGSGIHKPGLSVDENGEVVKVPAFLQKLYSMVSDTSTDELIYWSDSGDSFFVPNHERFGKELLPRFFKHSNFSSFVRQLNMYGFHKVPQPQTGVLKMDNPNDSELWEFVNPFFKRNHQHLLSKVMRKNNRPANAPPSTGSTGTRSSARQQASQTPGYPSQFLITDGTTEGEAGTIVGTSGQQMIDLAAITSGIAAIRQTQASIGADLKALQASNEHLWREALDSRERHRKHQETIDLIVSFLERLFGTEGEGLKGLKEALRRGGIGRPREDSGSEEVVGKKRKRLGLDRMISDGRNEEPRLRDDQIVEIQDEARDDPFNLTIPPRQSPNRSASSSAGTEKWSSASQRFQQLPSDDGSSPQRSADVSQNPTPTNPFAGFTPTGQTPNPNAIDPTALVPYFNQTGGPLSPTTAAAASALNLDPSLLQTTIGSLLQSPAAAQMFLSSLNNSVQGQALQTPRTQQSQPQFPTPDLTNIDPNLNNNQFDLGQLGQNAQNGQVPNPPPNGMNGMGAPGGTGMTPAADPTMALFSPLPNYQALSQNNDALLKSYENALGVGDDVDKLQESIDSLVRSMGLQPSDAQGAGNTGGNLPADGMGDMGLDPDFNVDDFLEHLGKDDE